jgi:PAS domain S-box-containing protein
MPKELIQFLRESEEVYRVVVENASDAILSIDENNIIIFANSAAERIFGYKTVELIGQTIDILMPDGFAALLRQDLLLYLGTGERRLSWENMQVQARRREGSNLTVEISFAESLRNGERIFIIVARDITERLRAERSLSESQAMLELALRSSGIGVWEQDLATDTVNWSPELEEIFGLEKGAFARTTAAFYEFVHEDDHQQIWVEVQNAIAEKREYEIEFRFHHADGSLRWMEGRGQAFYSEDGKPIRLYGIGVDITERKKAEEILHESSRDLRQMADAMPQVVWIADGKGVVNYYNSRVSEFYGGLGKSDSGIWNWQPFVHDDDVNLTIRSWEDSVRLQIPYSVEHRIKMNDGTFRWHLSRAFPVENERGKIAKWFGTATDIDDLKRASEALLQSEERLHQAVEISQTGIFEIDLTTGKTEVDLIGRNIYGWSENQFLTLDFVTQNHFHPEDRQQVLEILAATFASEGSDEFDIEHRVLRTDGATRWIRVRGRAFFTVENEIRRPVRCVGTYIDTTERKQVEDALRESEERFSKAFSASPLVLTISSLETGKLIEVNQAFVNATGYTREEAIGKTTVELGLWKKVSEREKEMETVRQAGQLSNAEYIFCTKAGGEIIGLLAAERIEIGGESFALTVIQDISERKRAEQEIKYQLDLTETITDNTQSCLLMMDAEGRGTFANHAAESVTGYTPEELIGKILHEVIHHTRPDGTPFPIADCPLDNALPIQEAVVNYEDVFVHKDGHFYPVRCSGRPIFKNGKPIGTVIEVQNITEEKRIESERAELFEREQTARREAEAANRAKDEFLSVLSHELRTPLNAILGWTRMLKSGSLDEIRNRQAIETIERNARLQNNLIEDLLDVSRIISGKMRIENENLDLMTIAVSAVETIRPSAEAKNITIEIQADQEKLEICGDSTRLQQIVVNLANNAVKFTSDGGTINVRLSKTDKKARLEISDTGVGISKELLPHIFDRFRQADSTTQRNHSGLGLGLTIVRHLVELHEGEIFARSDGAGKGATFIVEIPLLGDANEKLESCKNKVSAVENAAYDNVLRDKLILLVDDDCDGLQPLKLFFEMHGAEAVCADSAALALQEFVRRDFDLILSDIGMPEIDGYELIDQIRKLPVNAKVPAIALTAYASTDDRQRAIAAGFHTHHAKPLDFEKLLRTVVEIVNQSKETE